MVARLPLALMAVVLAWASGIERNRTIDLGIGRMRMVQAATAHHVYGHN